jgi:5-(carboxyamino)imidazole ribonucleotide mutase
MLGVADQSIADKVQAERIANAQALLAKDEAMQAKL